MEGMLRENTSVPQSQEKTPEQSTELPNPDLNPLLNPTLGRHLGRWAQVYFTSPPEKREEAVGELLRELQGDPLAGQTETPETAETIRIVEDAEPPVPVTQCSQCGYHSSNAQRFCGMCGASFSADEPVHHEFLTSESPSRPPAFSDQGSLERDLRDVHLSPAAERSNDNAFADVSWLREKSASAGTGSSSRRYAPAIVAVLAVGILFYAQSRPQGAPSRPDSSTNAPQASSTTSSKQTPPAPAEPSRTAEPPQKAASSPAPQVAAPPPETARREEQGVQPPRTDHTSQNNQNSIAEPRTWKPAASTASQTTTASQYAISSSAEVAQAEELLSGRTRPRDSVQAAQLLWRAVGKENPTAILMLSDLYRVGDGVPKSCDQARLLLTAAARKSVPQAAEKLRELLRAGCPN
jgi:hypothetical protein